MGFFDEPKFMFMTFLDKKSLVEFVNDNANYIISNLGFSIVREADNTYTLFYFGK